MIRWLTILIAGALISACSVSIKGPKAAFSEVSKAESNGFQVTAAYNSSVYRWPGFTWSVAGTYLPGTKSAAVAEKPAYAFESARDSAYKLSIAVTSECRPDPLASQHLAKAIDDLLGREGPVLPSKGQVEVHVVGQDVEINRYAVTLETGRSYGLKYWTPCIDGNANAALYYAAMVALHESTHASLDMVGAQASDLHERERIAYGAEACLYLSLRSKDQVFERVNGLLLQRFKQSTQLGTTSIDLTQLCNGWKAYIHAIERPSAY